MIEAMAGKLFGGQIYTTNLDSHYNGRIWITWRPDYYIVRPIDITAQVVTCVVQHIPSRLKFIMSFVYAFNTREERKELWSTLEKYSMVCKQP